MGVEPTKAGSAPPLNDFEDRGHHQDHGVEPLAAEHREHGSGRDPVLEHGREPGRQQRDRQQKTDRNKKPLHITGSCIHEGSWQVCRP